VALCTYNGARYLDEQLESIRRQTHSPHEVVICDDGSSDDTEHVVRSFANVTPFQVSVDFHGRRLGAAQNFARAIGECGGDWIVLSDQDDRWRMDRLERLAAVISNHAAVGAVMNDASLIDADGQQGPGTLWGGFAIDERTRRILQCGVGARVLLRRNLSTGAAFAFKANLRPLILPIPDGWMHDAWIALLAAATGIIVCDPERTVEYRLHGANQIGIASGAFGDRVERSRDYGRAELALQREAYRAARQRLTQSGAAPADVLSAIDEKIAHLDTRSGLSPIRARRVAAILRELLSRRYFRYSSGAWSAMRDLLRT
jgi:glycosyltransferase involved in cell wall biosynthesis